MIAPVPQTEPRSPFSQCFLSFAFGAWISLLIWATLAVLFGTDSNNDIAIVVLLSFVPGIIASAFGSFTVSGWIQFRLGRSGGKVDGNKAFIMGLAALVVLGGLFLAMDLFARLWPESLNVVGVAIVILWPILLGECIIVWSNYDSPNAAELEMQSVNQDPFGPEN